VVPAVIAALSALLAFGSCDGGRRVAPAPGREGGARTSDAAPSGDPGAPRPQVPAPADSSPPRPLVLGDVVVAHTLAWDARVPPPGDADLAEKVGEALVDAGALVRSARAPATSVDAGAAGPAGAGAAGAGAAESQARVEASVGLAVDGPPGRERGFTIAVRLGLRFREPAADLDLGGRTRNMVVQVAGEKRLGAAERARLPALVLATLPRTLAAAAAALAARERVRLGSPAEVIAALDHADADVRSEALRAVARRRLTEAIPRLIELLGHADVDVRDGALGALVEVRAEAAVKPLVEGVEFSDVEMMRRIIDAVGQIGGDEARAYLEFVASGHAEPTLRALAQAALERLERRSDAGPR
jgi:hypothetical protein